MPASFIAALAGIAMFTPLKNAFVAGFSGVFSRGALVCFLVTVSEITRLGISPILGHHVRLPSGMAHGPHAEED